MPRALLSVVTMVVVALALVAGGVQPVNAQTPNGNGRWSSGFGGMSFGGAFRVAELNCLGLPPGDYTDAVLWDGWSRMNLDGYGRLHVAAKGTYSWAIFPYADDITGVNDTQHLRLYFGSTSIDFEQIIDPYEPGSTFSYYLPSLVVSGINGAFTLVARANDPGSILVLSFADSEVGHPRAPGTGFGAGGGEPVCAASQ